MRLDEYLNQYNVSMNDFAKKSKVSRMNLERVLDGANITLETCFKIYFATERLVDLHELPYSVECIKNHQPIKTVALGHVVKNEPSEIDLSEMVRAELRRYGVLPTDVKNQKAQ
jgi:predicted transcriptional regulator